MKILVAGSEGFLGSHLIESLHEWPSIDEVIGFDVREHSNHQDITYHKIDVSDKEMVMDAVADVKLGPEGILFHLVILMHNLAKKEDDEKRILIEKERRVNIEGTSNLFEASYTNNIGRVFMPTSVDVWVPTKDGMLEPARLCNYSNQRKEIVKMYERLLLTATFPQICGQDENPVGEPKKYRSILEAMIKGEPLEIKLSPHPVPYAHVSDIMQAIRYLCESKEPITHFPRVPAVYLSPQDLLAVGCELQLDTSRISINDSSRGSLFDQRFNAGILLDSNFRLIYDSPVSLLKRYINDIKPE